MKESEGPDVKSIVTDFPSAASGGQPSSQGLGDWFKFLQKEASLLLTRGLQLVYV